MGNWIAIRSELMREPEYLAMKTRLGCTDRDLLGSLCILWVFAKDYGSERGQDMVVPPKIFGMVKDLLLPGLLERLEAVSWLRREGEGAVLPGFLKYNGQRPDSVASVAKTDWKGVVRKWNEVAGELQLPQIRGVFSKRRQGMFRSRASEFGVMWFEEALAEVRKAEAWWLGENERGWRIDVDYLLSPKGSEKILSGGISEARLKGKAKAKDTTMSVDDLFGELQ